MRIAALYDIHGNLPALEAVLGAVRDAGVVGGDVVPGPMPEAAIQLLLDFERPAHFLSGNGELAILAQMAAASEDDVTYWGTVSGATPPEPFRAEFRWTAERLKTGYRETMTTWPKNLKIEIEGLGTTHFCHSTP